MGIRKYIFFNLASLCSYICLYWLIYMGTTKYPPCGGHNDAICPKDIDIAFLILIGLLLVCLFLLGFVEILIRKLIKKFIVGKYFYDFKLNINIKIPKIIVVLYNILFFTGFVPGFILFLIIVYGTAKSAIYAILH